MRQIGEQWVENGMLYKSVEGVPNFWIGCCWSDAYHCFGVEDCPTNHIKTGLIVRVLGPFNEEGCLAEERTGLFPVVENHFHNLWVVTLITNDFPKIIQVSCYGATKQQAIDTWNWRA